MKFEQIGIIGCGLIGCSFALAAKKAGIASRIIGYSKSDTETQEAKTIGILDEAVLSAQQAAFGSDLVLLATPVGAMEGVFSVISPVTAADTLIMDVGSTKTNVVEAAKKSLGQKLSHFVPAHPIAGSNKSGHQAANADLFQGAKVIITPVEETNALHLHQAISIWESIGSQVQIMPPNEHDHALAAVSHFPHLLAFAFMEEILSNKKSNDFLSLAGDGFKDFTRIAASEPTLWRDVFMANKEEMIQLIAAFKSNLTAYEALLQQEDHQNLLEKLENTSQSRSLWQR